MHTPTLLARPAYTKGAPALTLLSHTQLVQRVECRSTHAHPACALAHPCQCHASNRAGATMMPIAGTMPQGSPH